MPMAGQTALTESQIRWAVQLYEQGWTVLAVARQFHVSESAMHKYFVVRGVPTRNRGKRVGDMQALEAKREEILDMIFLYTRLRLTFAEIAEGFGIHSSTIQYRFRRYGIPSRTRSEYARLCAEKRNLKLAS
jgi:AraC-like DNA-binding protein